MNLQEKVNHLNHGMYQPTFKPTNTNVTVGPGDRAVLRCRVENLGTKTVSVIVLQCLYSAIINAIMYFIVQLEENHHTLGE